MRLRHGMVGHDRPRVCPVTGQRHGSTTTQRQGGVGYSGPLGARGVTAICADCGTSVAFGWGALTNDGRVVSYAESSDDWRGFYRLRVDAIHGENVLVKVYARSEEEGETFRKIWIRRAKARRIVRAAIERANIARRVG